MIGQPIHNRLLRAMPPATLERLRPLLTPVSLVSGHVIARLDEPVTRLYFVNRGFVSMVKTMRDGRTVEVGGVGVEGLTAARAVLGDETALLDWVVQIPGEAFRIGRDTLEREMRSDPALLRLIMKYTHFMVSQVIQTAACNRLHSLEERCARWMLIAHDNALADQFRLTHEFLATMLGVQRPSVSLAASTLRRAGLIDYTRGVVTILDRPGLEAVACECYAAMHHELGVTFAPPHQHAEVASQMSGA